MARCTVERLTRTHGWEGVRRVTKVPTKIADPTAERAPDLVSIGSSARARPIRLLVADFTYVRMASGCFAYTAFVIDAFANRILGWKCSTSKETTFVATAIRLSDLESLTAAWVHWYNTSRLMHHIGPIPPFETNPTTMPKTVTAKRLRTRDQACTKPGGLHRRHNQCTGHRGHPSRHATVRTIAD